MDTAPVLALPQLGIIPSLPTGDVVTLVFYIVIGIYAIFTAVLYYHWHTYTSDAKVSTATYIAYFAITIPLLIVMGSSVLIF
jgi:heme/copper-type cytochrome/quinol oxidase subunit 2